jgi:uncharacterized protein (TIGR00251 family)
MIKITPNAHKNEIVGWQGDVLKVKIEAPPEKGKANDLLIEFLAETFSLAKQNIRIVSGHTSRLKKVEINGEIDYLYKALPKR